MSLKYLKMDKPKPRFRVHREYRVQYRLCGDSRPTLGAILFQHSVNTQAGGPPLRFVQRRDSTAPIQMEFSVRSTKSSICVIVAELCSAWAVQRPAPTWPARRAKTVIRNRKLLHLIPIQVFGSLELPPLTS